MRVVEEAGEEEGGAQKFKVNMYLHSISFMSYYIIQVN